MSVVRNNIFSTSLFQIVLQSLSVQVASDMMVFSTSTLLQCICSLISEVIVFVILQTFSSASGRLVGKLLRTVLHLNILYIIVEVNILYIIVEVNILYIIVEVK